MQILIVPGHLPNLYIPRRADQCSIGGTLANRKYISAENLHSHILFRRPYTVLLTYSAISHRPQSCLLAAVALTVFLSTTTAEPSFPQHPATLLLLESALSPSSRNFLKPSENPHEKHSAVPLPQNMAGKYLSALPFFRTLRVLQLLRPPALHQYPISHSAILSPLRTFVLSQLYTAWIPISIVKHNIFYLFSILFLLNAQ